MTFQCQDCHGNHYIRNQDGMIKNCKCIDGDSEEIQTVLCGEFGGGPEPALRAG